MTKYQNELNKVLSGLPERERELTAMAFKLGWDAAIHSATMEMFDTDYNIERPLEVLNYGKSLQDELLQLYSWVKE